MPNPNAQAPKSTRFTSENQPKNRGRKKGSPHQGALTKRVNERLDTMLGEAHKVIKQKLEDNHAQTAMWLVDTVRKERGDSLDPSLLAPLVGAVETLEDVELISERALLLAIKGDMTFPQLKAVQQALQEHSVIKGTVELRQLRADLEDLREGDDTKKALGTDHLPTWGRLRDVTPDGDDQPSDPPPEHDEP